MYPEQMSLFYCGRQFDFIILTTVALMYVIIIMVDE